MLDLIVIPAVAGVVIVLIHCYLGLQVLARGVIFVDLAFAQIAALGTTVALLIGADPGSPISLALALGFTVVGALIFSFTRMEKSIVPQEAIVGSCYVVASAAVILVSSFTAEGAEHIAETLTGTLIWVGWSDVLRMAGAYAVIAVVHFVFRRRLLDATFRPEQVSRPRLWDFVFYMTFGIVISFSVAVAGVLMIFSTLVIPAIVAFMFTSRFKHALIIACITGTLAVLGGITGSFVLDIATGPFLVVVFGGMLVAAFPVRALLRIQPESEVTF